MSSIREQIVGKVMAVFAGLEGVGLVVDQADAREEDQLGEVLKAGKAHVQLVVLDDVSTESDEADSMGKQGFRFRVLGVLTFPQALLGPKGSGRTPSLVASGWLAKLKDEIWGGGRGGQWDGLAMRTLFVGGGGVAYADDGSQANLLTTTLAFDVEYRHALGQAGTL